MAEALRESGSSTAPVSSWVEGLARVGQGLAGGYLSRQAKQKIEDRENKAASDRAAMMGAFIKEHQTADIDVGHGGGPPGNRVYAPGPMVPGGYSSAIMEGQKRNNPDNQEFLNQLIMGQFEQNQAGDAAARLRAQGMEDYRTQAEIDAENRAPTIDKFSTPYVIADPDSSTGYSRRRINQAGDMENLGPAPAPTKMYDPNAAQNEAQYKTTFERYNQAMSNINESDMVLADAQSMLNLVGSVNSGTFAETKLALKKFALAIGMEVDLTEIANAEAMKSKGMDFVLQRIDKTKGAISEKEMRAFKEASAGLENTPEGNRMILELAQKVAERMKFESNAVREAWGENPSISVYDLDNVQIQARQDFNEKFGEMSVEPESAVPESGAADNVPISEMDFLQLNALHEEGVTEQQEIEMNLRLDELGIGVPQ
tara:strand:- start:1962 stop:3245 length:1284 start_codon:yes stop_codon:yes gene_type:complete